MEVGDFLGDSVLLVRSEKGTGVLLTANAVGNFVKYMLFTAAYNIQKTSTMLFDSPRRERIYK